MTASEEEITTRFLRELDGIALNFIQAFNLKYEQKVDRLNDPLLRWMDFRLRYIDPKPRRIVLSNKFPKRLPVGVGQALQKMEGRILRGLDINPYQGLGLILHHDTSGRKKQFRTDLLWADWGITHLHLSDEIVAGEEYFSSRADWLLFALVTRDEFGFVDVRPHQESGVFSTQELMEVVAESWPQWIDQFHLKGMLPSTQSYTSQELHELRKSGMATCITIGDKVYMGPGMGITSAATSLKVGMKSDRVFEFVKYLAQMVCDSEEQFQKAVRSSKIDDTSFHLCITPKGMAVYEEKLDMAWVLPKVTSGVKENFLTELHNLMAPDWAVTQFLKATSPVPSRY